VALRAHNCRTKIISGARRALQVVDLAGGIEPGTERPQLGRKAPERDNQRSGAEVPWG